VAGDHAPRGLAARYGPVQAGGIARKWEVRGILAPWSGRPGGSDHNEPPRRAPLGWALGLLERLHARAATQARTGSLIEIQALQALARSADGDQPGALTALAEALALAAPEGYLRVFVDEGPPMAALLRQLRPSPGRGSWGCCPSPRLSPPATTLVRRLRAASCLKIPSRSHLWVMPRPPGLS
jgi:hypothetical protein